MTDGFMSSWPLGDALGQRILCDQETTASQLPAVRFLTSALLEIRRALLFAQSGINLGVLHGYRCSLPDEHICFDSLVASSSPSIRPSAVTLTLGITPSSRKRWRSGYTGGDSSLLQLFGAVASPVLLEDGQGIRVRIRVSLPRYTLTCWEALASDSSPSVADISLAIVLHGGDTAKEGEQIGFLVRDANKRDVVEPVYLNDTVDRRGIIGVWALCKRDFWAATAVFAAESMTSRNLKIKKNRNDVGSRRVISFLFAQFHERTGGDPDFFPCTLTLPSASEPHYATYAAQVNAFTDELSMPGNQALNAQFMEEGILDTRTNTYRMQRMIANNLDTTDLKTPMTLSAPRALAPESDPAPQQGGDIPHQLRDEVDDAESQEKITSRFECSCSSRSSDGDSRSLTSPGDSSPVLNAKAHLRDMARQVEQLRADLRSLPSASYSAQHCRDSVNGGADEQFCHLRRSASEDLELTLPTSKGPLSSQFFRSSRIRQDGSSDWRGIAIPRIKERLGGDNNLLDQSPQVGIVSEEVIDARLHQLAQKYLGLDYQPALGSSRSHENI